MEKPLEKPLIPMVEMWKTIDNDGSLVKKPLKNHWPQWYLDENHWHSIVPKNLPSPWSSCNLRKCYTDSNENRFYLCYLLQKTKPKRGIGNKWFVSFQDYPQEFYPDYCCGWAYVTNIPTIKSILGTYSVVNQLLRSLTPVLKHFI